MTSKFRRNTDRAFLNHLNDYQDIRKDVNVVQDTTTNPTILNIINPAFGDLDMNNKDIMNCGDTETKTINSKIPLYNPSISYLDMNSNPIFGCSSLGTNEIDGGNLLIRSQGPMIIESINDDIQINNNINFTAHDLYDIKSMSGLSISARNMQSDTAGAVSFNSDLDMKTHNISNVGTINGGSILTNPLATTFNASGNSLINVGSLTMTGGITTQDIIPESSTYDIGSDVIPYDFIYCNELTTTGISAFPGYTEIVINKDLQLDDHSLKRITTVNTRNINEAVLGGGVNVLSDMKFSTKNITGVNNIAVSTINGITPSSFIVSPLSAPLNANGYTISNVGIINTNAITTNSITSAVGMVDIRGDYLANNLASIYDLFAMRTNTAIVNSLSKNTTLAGTDISVLSTLDLKTNNNIIGVNNIACTTINGLTPSTFLRSPLVAVLDGGNQNLTNLNTITTKTLTVSERAFLQIASSTFNTATFTTINTLTYTDINFGSTLPIISSFAFSNVGNVWTYTGTKTANLNISATITCKTNLTALADYFHSITIAKNGVASNMQLLVDIQNLNDGKVNYSSATHATYNAIIPVVQNDTLKFVVKSITLGGGFLGMSLNATFMDI